MCSTPGIKLLVGSKSTHPAVLVQTDRLGTSVAASLRAQSDSLRVKRRQRAEEAAHKVAVKLVFPLVLCIFPELLLVLLGPGFISTFRSLAKIAVNNR